MVPALTAAAAAAYVASVRDASRLNLDCNDSCVNSEDPNG